MNVHDFSPITTSCMYNSSLLISYYFFCQKQTQWFKSLGKSLDLQIRNWLFDLVSKIIITKRLSLVKPEAVQFCALVTLLAAPALLNPAFHIAPSKHESNSAGQLRWGIFPCYLMTKRQNTIRVNSALSSVMNIYGNTGCQVFEEGIQNQIGLDRLDGQKSTYTKEIIEF